MQGYLPGAYHRVKLVLYLVLGVGDLPGLHPEVLHVIAAAELQRDQVVKFAADVALAVSRFHDLVLGPGRLA